MVNTEPQKPTPLISLVINGFTEKFSYDEVDTFKAIKCQSFPLSKVELIFVGSSEQIQRTQEKYKELQFFAIKTVVIEGATYTEEKHLGAEVATGKIIAFADMDASPGPKWLESIAETIERGADVAGGLVFFHAKNGWTPSHPIMQILAALGKGGKSLKMSNTAFRSSVYRKYPYRPELERRGAGIALYKEYIGSNLKVVFPKEQYVSHSFTLVSWIQTNIRHGFETIIVRHNDPWAPHRWVRKTYILEPILTTLWRIALDLPHWIIFSQEVGIGKVQRFVLLPLVIFFSFLARNSQMLGMYGALFIPAKMQQYSQTH